MIAALSELKNYRLVRASSLVLQQLIVLSQLAQFGAKAAVLAAQGGELAAQLRLQLPVGLEISLQALNVLLQPWRTQNFIRNRFMFPVLTVSQSESDRFSSSD